MARRLAAAILATAWLAGSLPHVDARSQAPASASLLHDVRGVDDLHAAFDQDRGKVRIIMLLSPT